MISPEEILKIYEVEMLQTTGKKYTFRTRPRSKKSKKLEYHIIKPRGSDQGFHLYRMLKGGPIWYTDPNQALEDFNRDYYEWPSSLNIK